MLSTLLNLLYPSRCPVCGSSSTSHAHNPLCEHCWSEITRYTGPACRICGLPTPADQTTTCGECLREEPPFSKVMYYGIYEGALKKTVHLFKFGGITRLAKPLSLLLSALPLPECDAVVPVPLQKSRLLTREFNQTALLGQKIAKHLNVPLLVDAMSKVKKTKDQTEVTGKERRKNIRNVFTVERSVAGLRVLLIDDVITTGATALECARVLKKAGARDVVVVALARSMPHY